MYKILHKQQLAKDIVLLEVEAPQIAKKTKAGQFVVVVSDEKGERIPLTISDWDENSGTITLIFQMVGYTTKKLGLLKKGDFIAHVLGPLGHPTEVKNLGAVVCIGGGIGIAEIYPVVRAFKRIGNKVTCIIGARAKELLILEDKLKRISDELLIVTDDGSYGEKGLVTDILKKLLSHKPQATSYALIYAVGPVPMMEAVSGLTEQYNIKTIVSLNPIMVDATGMCGSCRCTVGNKPVFGCVDGPDFDAHQVDFNELKQRLSVFKLQEKQIDEKP
jgi:ferredoxin--NADP+ reductase